MYKMNLGKMFFLLLIFSGVTCSAQCNVEDSLFFCPKGYYKIIKIDKIKNSEDKEYFYEGLKSRKKSSLYIISAKRIDKIFDESLQCEQKVVRILSVKECGKAKGNILKKNRIYYFNLVSLYWKITELGDMLSHVNNEGFYYKGYYIHRLEHEDIESIYETNQLDGLSYNVSGFSY